MNSVVNKNIEDLKPESLFIRLIMLGCFFPLCSSTSWYRTTFISIGNMHGTFSLCVFFGAITALHQVSLSILPHHHQSLSFASSSCTVECNLIHANIENLLLFPLPLPLTDYFTSSGKFGIFNSIFGWVLVENI